MVNPFLRKTAFLLSALTFGLNGCNTQPSTAPQQEQENSATASFAIKAADFYNPSGTSQNRTLSASSLTSAQAFSFSDVTSIRIDVTDKDANAPLYLNFDLLPLDPDGWIGKLPFLPKNKPLLFSAKAFNSAGTLLFRGSTNQLLDKSHQTIVMTLAAANDGDDISIPRIRKITVPSVFGADQTGNVSFSVEANNGETVTYEITSPEGSGTFYPTSGTITLEAISGTFVSQYAPPIVEANTEYTHTVKVTNAAGHSVTTTFKTKVKPPGRSDGVIDTGVEVLFSPVINSLSSSREFGTGKVSFNAAVTDNEDVSSLTYQWSFEPTEGTSFDLDFTDAGTTNPTTILNYTTDVRGTITLVVTDSDGASTTLKYPLTPNQFPDNPVVEGGLTGINSIRAGESHTCVLFNNGGMRCWGLNTSGQLGNGDTFAIGDDEKPSSKDNLQLLGTATRIAVGGNHTCALLNTGLVRCWGDNTYGQLGYNTKEPKVGDGESIISYGYVNVGGPVTKIAAGYEHTCALQETGDVRCWGRNNYGQLGHGDTEDIGDDEQPYRASVVKLEENVKVKDIVAGGYHTCALMESGNVRCWGYNEYGQLGLGTTYNNNNIGDSEPPSSVPPVSVGGANALQLAAGKYHTCALLSTGNMRCWGNNGSGRLGYGSSVGEVHAPTSDVPVGGHVLQIAAGESHTCALLGTGGVKCWGNGANGRLGYGTTDPQYVPRPNTVFLDDASAFQITAGGNHTCALLSTGAARCWGFNTSGQLGRGDKTSIGDSESPTSEGDIELIKP